MVGGVSGATAEPTPDPRRIDIVAAAAFARTAAERIAGLIADGAAARGSVAIALAGGSTPEPVYRALAARRDVPWDAVAVFFGDERAVPPDDAESNYRMARETLLDHVPVPPTRIHRMAGESADLVEAAAAYERVLPDRFDVVILGIGEDGHTASLFPGSAALAEHDRPVVPVVGPKPPPRRLTLTPPVLRRARATVVLAKGDGKAEAVARALEGTYDPAHCPAQLARAGYWILDEAAATRLRHLAA